MYESLKIINWPDPRLKKISRPVEVFNEDLQRLTARMFELMRERRGVGLAAPQVGLNIRLFVINPSGEAQDDRIYVNPELFDLEGEEEAEEGCLSLPQVNINVWRAKNARIRAQNLQGGTFEEALSGYVPRIWQHEQDHLNGTLLTDRMGAVAKMSHRRILKDLQEKYFAEHPPAPSAKPARSKAKRR
jgi:peptide deformylase